MSATSRTCNVLARACTHLWMPRQVQAVLEEDWHVVGCCICPASDAMPCCTNRPWQRNSNQIASDEPGTNSPQSVAAGVDKLYHAARVMPERDWTWLKAVKARLYRAAPAHARRGPVITSIQLLDLGEQLMDESKSTPDTPISTGDAVRYRDGLMAALLAFIPIRHKNLAELEINRHLVREDDRARRELVQIKLL